MNRASFDRARLTRRHAALLVVFLAGAGFSLVREAVIDLGSVIGALLLGVMAVFLFHVVIGLWEFTQEYRRAGGKWTDMAFLVPVAVGLTVAAGVVVDSRPFELLDLWTGFWAGFWAFVFAAGAAAVVVWMRLGFREGRKNAS